MKNDLQFWKDQARASNRLRDFNTVTRIIADHLVPAFGNDHAAAHRFYAELEQAAPASTVELR